MTTSIKFDPSTLTLWLGNRPIQSIELTDGNYFIVQQFRSGTSLHAYTMSKSNAMKYQLALYRQGYFDAPSKFNIEIIYNHGEDIVNVHYETKSTCQ